MWRERRKLVDMWRAGRAAALATLVAVEGSSYRRPGARLMIATDGEVAGSISGGCLEADVARKMRWLVREGACMQRYSTAFDDTSDLPYGSGCGGTVEVLMEPAGTPEFETLMAALARSLEGIPADVETVLPADGNSLSRAVTLGNDALLPDTAKVGRYHERLLPPQRLFVLGAGDDAQPLVSMAALLGWRVFVLDGRAQWARHERFPEAECVIAASAELPEAIHLQRDDFAVVMTHSFEQDRAWMQLLLPAHIRYLGLLGAKHRSALLAGELAGALGWPIEQVCDQLLAPVGLDLGGEGAEAIALAILAEMQACAAHKPLHARRMTPDMVTRQMDRFSVSGRPRVQCAM